MTMILEIPPDLQNQIERAARQDNTDAASWLLDTAREKVGTASERTDEVARLAAIDASFGMFAGQNRSVDEFLAERHAEGEADFLRWQEKQGARPTEGTDS